MMAGRWQPVVLRAVLLILLAGCGGSEPTVTLRPPTPTAIAPSPTEAPSPWADATLAPTVTMAATDAPLPTVSAPPPTLTLATPDSSPTASQTVLSPKPGTLEGEILFSYYPDGDIAVMNADGSDQRLLLDQRMSDGLLSDRLAVWQSGEGGISYVVDDFERAEIWMMSADGRDRQLLVAEVAPVTSHSWSPDGGRLAFVSAEHAICVLDLADNTITRLTDEHLRDARDPDWSPDGSALAFSASDGGNQDIYVVSAEGTGLARITSHSAPDKHPDWSPDGTELVFSSNRRSPRFSDVYLLDLGLGTEGEGNQPIQLTAEDRLETRPDWSPDGSWIVYLSHELGAGHGTIYALEVSTRGRIQISADNTYHSPRWRP